MQAFFVVLLFCFAEAADADMLYSFRFDDSIFNGQLKHLYILI